MDSLPPNAIIEFNSNQMNDVREIFNYSDVNRLHQDLKILEDWIRMQEHFIVKDYDKEYLERYLISSKGSVERAKQRLDKICTLRGLMPDYLQNFDVKNEFNNFFKTSYMGVLPKPTSENYRLIFYTTHTADPSSFEHIYIARYLMVVFQYLYCYDYNAGVELIFDMRKFSFPMVTKISPIVVANAMLISIEGLGLRLRGIHILNESKILDAVVAIVRQGLSKKLNSRVRMHESIESLHDYFPKALLPADYGGDLSSSKDICENVLKEISKPEFTEKLKYMEGALTDESKRLRVTFNEQYSGMPGSFKVLSVD